MSEPDSDESFLGELRSAVGTVARRLESDGYGAGDVAELRRISPEEPYTPALWKVMEDLDLRETPYWLSEDERETRWAALLMGMAMTTGLHEFDRPLGSALAEAGWSELRFVRLMRADGERLIEEVRRMAQYLSSKEEAADWTDVGKIVFSQTGEYAEEYRRDVARDYYSALYRQENQEAAE
ncbi:MAG: type I-E CRISPR-associated protein Cse2/CasB [Bradymonadaceae bacterium]